MKNVTITLDEQVARWARVRAAEHEQSLSRFVGELLKRRMGSEERYASAQRWFLAQQPSVLRERATPYPSRDELHDRARLR